MERIQRYNLTNGGTVDIEIEEVKKKGGGAVGTGVGKKIKESTENFKDVLDVIPSLTEDIHSSIIAKQSTASEVQVEFGFKFGVDMGIIIAKSSAEANFKVSIKWKMDDN